MNYLLSPYNFGERVFRTAVFQNGVAHHGLERFLIKFIEGCRQITCHPNIFNPERAAAGLALWQALGASEFTITSRDEQANIFGVFLRARDLEDILGNLGARWEKLETVNEGQVQSILAIILPVSVNRGDAWQVFERNMQKFRWPREQVTTTQGETFDVIITCREADALAPEEFSTRVFLHSNSASVSYIMLRRRAGFYLGMKQDICFYDPRGTWKSTGVASEGGYYNDILAVYEEVCMHYSPEQIWVSGACLGCNAAAFLKAHTRAPFNLILENGFVNFERDFIDHENLVARTFARWFRNGLFSNDIPPNVKPHETGFNIEEMWRELPSDLGGKVVIVGVENDQRLPHSVRRNNVVVARRISQVVYPIAFHSQDGDPHFDRYFNYPEARRSLVRVFNTFPPDHLLNEPYSPQTKRISFKLVLITAMVAIFSFFIRQQLFLQNNDI